MSVPPNTEVIEKKVDVEAALSRMRRPLDITTVNVEVFGVYSLPEQWRQKIAENDPSEQSFQYELEVCGMSMRSAKVFARELTEEEKAEAAAAANAKGGKQPPAPAKADPKKGAGIEEPNKEELERLEREKKEREERERKLREEWDSLDEETKFFRTAEDIFKQPCIKFQNIAANKKIEALQSQIAAAAPDSEEAKELQAQLNDLQARIFTGHIASEKQGFELVEFEEWVQKDKGCWIRFMKLVTQDDAAAVDPKAAAAAKGAPAKGAPAKGAGGPTEMKPYYARAWVSFEDLLKPGALETKQRVFLETCQPMIKKVGEDGVERWVPSEEAQDPIFESVRTYVILKITLSDAVTPQALPPHSPGEPLPQDVVPVKQFIRWPFSKQPTDDFKKQVNLAVESLAKEYYTLFKDDLLTEQRDRSKTESDRRGAFEERKKEFLYEINTSGKYHIMKEKMKKTIVRIVKEHFQKKSEEGGIKGIYKDERDHFYSQLYAYLVAQMRQTVQEIVARKKNELHENITVPKEQYAIERDRVITQVQNSAGDTAETLTERYKRLAWENEWLYNNSSEAEQFILKFLSTQEGDSNAMLEVGRFYLRQGKQEKADQYLRDAYSYQIKNQKVAFMYASYLLQLNRSKEAQVILNRLTFEQYEPVNVALLMSLAYEADQDPLLAAKYKSIAFLQKLRKLENSPIAPLGQTREHGKPQAIPPKAAPLATGEETVKVESAPAYQNHRLTADQEDALYLALAQTLQQECAWHLARKVIGLIRNSESLDVQLTLGRILLEKGNYSDAIRPFQWIVSQDETNVVTISNIGHCHYALGAYKDAENCYVQALRISSFSGRPLEDPLVLLRMGSLYNAQKLYGEAAVIFEECFIKFPNNSFSLLNYGVTLIYNNKQPNYESAVKYLSRANQLNPYNADIWGYLVFSSLQINQHIQAFQAQKEAIKLKLANVDLLQQIAQSWLSLKRSAEAKEALEYALRARASTKQAKKVEDFLKAAEGATNQVEIKAKARELLIKGCQLKEDDWIVQRYVETVGGLLAAK